MNYFGHYFHLDLTSKDWNGKKAQEHWNVGFGSLWPVMPSLFILHVDWGNVKFEIQCSPLVAYWVSNEMVHLIFFEVYHLNVFDIGI